jgi:6-phosphogluconolactonase
MNVKARPQIVVVTDAAALAETAARRLIARVTRGDRAAVCLTGGSSPLGLYRLLAQHPWREQVPWDRVHWFMGDDRFVPENDQLSNMGAARRAFLDHVPAPRQNIHPIVTDTNHPEAAARLYEDELKQFYGADRHTASLFPHSPALEEKDRWVLGIAKAGMEPFVPRVTLTFPALAATREMLFLIDSADKRPILKRVLAGEDLPAHRAYADGDLVWLVIQAAAPER